MLNRQKTMLANSLNLPKDVMLGELLVSFVGRQSVTIENYRSIILYTDTLLKLQGKNCRLSIEGSRLNIEYYTDDEMKLTGQIKSVLFET